MIGHLRGKILFTGEKYIILDVSGVGYKVHASVDTLQRAREGVGMALWIYHVVREDASDLYGFLERDELGFFELLLGVSGIGPKAALGVLSAAPPETLLHAIRENDTTSLTKISGIGKKTAQKVVLELKDKLGGITVSGNGMPGGPSTQLKEEAEAFEALEALGYSLSDVREALKTIPTDATTTNEKIKAALKVLGK